MKNIWIYFIVTFLVSACGLKSLTGDEPQSYSFDGVKLIRPDINDGMDARTSLQSQYAVSDSSRVLLRFEDFLSKVGSISLGGGKKVTVVLTLDAATDMTLAQTELRLCPILTSWMMAATWFKAHPFGGGAWHALGGDYDSAACLTATSFADHTLKFDVTPWVVNYAIGRNQNYGLILFSSTVNSYLITGEQDGANSPRIEWMSF